MGDERLCIVCPALHPSRRPRYVHVPHVCEACRADLSDYLAEVPGLVNATLGKIQLESGHGPRVSGSRERPSPLNLTALGVTVPHYGRGPRAAPYLDVHNDPASMADQLGLIPPVVTLDHWVLDWILIRDAGEHRPVPTIDAIASWLGIRLEWACAEHHAVDEFAADLKDMIRKLRGIVRDDAGVGESAGRCPSVLRNEDRCNTPLTVDPYVDVIQCARCGKSWPRRGGGWTKLRAGQDEWDDKAEEAA